MRSKKLRWTHEADLGIKKHFTFDFNGLRLQVNSRKYLSNFKLRQAILRLVIFLFFVKALTKYAYDFIDLFHLKYVYFDQSVKKKEV